MKAAGILFDSSVHYLDHLAPFCALLEIPLIVLDPSLRELAEKFYPGLSLCSRHSSEFTHLVSCEPRPLFATEISTLWLPHGHSDKGAFSDRFQALRRESALLVYGEAMHRRILREQLPPPCIRVGNFRHLYYQMHKAFYDSLPLGLAFAREQPLVLYAPTWDDSENNSSFEESFPQLAAHLPDSMNLLVKLHPNTLAQKQPLVERLIGRFERGNLRFLDEFPPVFPLLARADFYLGDRSSIGYDYLLFDRPLSFLDPPRAASGRDLLACGAAATPESAFMPQAKDYSQQRKDMASYVFDSVTLDELKRRFFQVGSCSS